MPKLSQLEIISPSGEIQFHDLDPAKGVANIGQHPDNDIVIKSPGVAPFHAVVDHRQMPYQIMFFTEDGETTLRGERLAANVFHELDHWDTIEVDGHVIILLEGVEVPAVAEPLSAPVPVPIPAVATTATVLVLDPESEPVATLESVGLPARPPDQVDEVIVADMEEREWTVDVEQTATCEMTIVNGGDLVATFVVVVEGLDESWITISAPQINLYEGGRATVAIAMQPPRFPTSTAGHHHLAVVVTSPNYPGRMSRLGATLTVNPYYEFAVGELSPKQQTVRWRKRTGQVTLPVTNKGNSETPFRFEGEDDERACRFEFEIPGEETLFVRQAEIRVEPGTARVLTTHITPIRRRLFALRKRSYAYTITTTLVEGAQMPRAVMGQLKSSALFGPLLPLLMLLGLAVLTVILFRPTSLPVLVTDNATPESGEAVTLSYWAYRFPRWSSQNILNRLNALFLALRMEHQSIDGEWQTLYTSAEFEEAVGKIIDIPLENGRYRMLADTWLSKLIPRLQGVSLEVPVYVDPVEPEISEFSADRTTVFAGDTVTLYWKARDAESLTLEYNGIQETIEENEMEHGTRSMTLEQNTTFSLVATNSSWPQEKRRPLLIAVLVPTVTPPPTPIILRFDVDPLEITAGEIIRVSWEVIGADTVDITQLGAGLPLKGDVGAEPGASTFYELTAYKSAEDGTQVKNQSLLQEVVVNPEPSPTPEPEMPVIEVFAPTPKEVIAGEGESVKLTWSVTGDTTNVQIAAPNMAFDGLASQDVVIVTVNETTLFVLSAVNGDLKTSQAVEVKAIPPTPTPEPTEPPPPPTPVPT
ncbi:FHA domain-containing protein, partial [Chloroflexota bacterium]